MIIALVISPNSKRRIVILVLLEGLQMVFFGMWNTIGMCHVVWFQCCTKGEGHLNQLVGTC